MKINYCQSLLPTKESQIIRFSWFRCERYRFMPVSTKRAMSLRLIDEHEKRLVVVQRDFFIPAKKRKLLEVDPYNSYIISIPPILSPRGPVKWEALNLYPG